MLKNNFYMDDLEGGAETIEEAIEKTQKLMAVLDSYGLNLRKWTSNSPEFLKSISIEHQEPTAHLEMTQKCDIKTLGLHWNPSTDTFSYTLKLPERTAVATKRTFLSDYSMLFDPLGWLSPALVLPKIMLQHIWLKGIP